MSSFESPDGSLVVQESLTGTDQTLTVTRDDRTVIRFTELGLTAPLDEASPPAVTGTTSEQRTVERSFEMASGNTSHARVRRYGSHDEL